MLMKEKQFLKELLVREVIPATGCTEAGAIALATGWAVQAYGGSTDEIEEITIEVDEGTYKNALGVGIPGTRETGLGFAAAMGASLCERVCQELQILENPTDEAIGRARALIAKNRIRVIRLRDSKDILIRSMVRSKKDEASAVIRGSHDHVVSVERNGKPYTGAPVPEENSWGLAQKVKGLQYSIVIDFIKEMNPPELPILRQAMEMNMHFAEEARKGAPSLNIGRVMEKHAGRGLTGKGFPAKVQFVTALAVEARMKGLDLPVMACAGSGNMGLVATIPVVETAKAVDSSEETVLRALALSYLTTIYIKAYTGLMSPVCGCGVAAAVGAGCGMVFLLGGDILQIEAQINNMVGTMAGIICDGAKSGCALKALMAVGLAVESAYLSLENVRIPSTDGIVGGQVVDTLENLQRIIEAGMSSMDTAIVDVMEKKGGNGVEAEE
jgi:L-cysteine desulfidase